MKRCIYYASRSGNTRAVAEAMAEVFAAHGEAEVKDVTAGPAAVPLDADLVVVGGPTEGRHATPAMNEFFDSLPAGSLGGRSAAAFDTRLDWPRWLSGSAAADIARRLESAGARLVAAPESFLVTTKPALESDELAHARRWAASLVASNSLSAPIAEPTAS